MEMIRQQQLDVLGKVLYELEAIQTPLRFSGVKWNQPILKRFKQIQSQLQLVNGVLTRNYKVEPFSDLRSVIIVPDTLKQDLLCQAHDDAGHQGVERTLSRAKYLEFWVGMASIHEYVTSCETCQKAKLPLPVRAPLLNTPIGRTMQLVNVDVLEVPVNTKGHRYILVFEDAFTKWLECIPMSDQKAETITNILVDFC